ncbi:MAG TPA: transposase [Acidimicrobiales bacterium]|nr:transposase [Acidimicrobiales bacterium]
MIASDIQALAIGTARLVVDGTDEELCRKAEFSLSPGRAKARRLRTLVDLSREVYNAALEHRRDAWRMAGVTVSTFDQFNEISELRVFRRDVASFGNQFVRGSISRVDEAFSAFFRRCRAGETPGFPRFKSCKRFCTAFYDEPCCWGLKGLEGEDPILYVHGVGQIPVSKQAVRQLRRLSERGGEPRTLTITRQPSGSWRACVGFRGVAAKKLPPKTEVGGVDRGIAVTAALPDGALLEMPKFLADARDEIAELSGLRELEMKGSSEWRRLNKQIAKAYRKARARSENWARHAGIEIVARYGVIAIEWLKLVKMTKSARGTKENPGKNVKAKSGLNRSLQDAALGRLAFWICVKAEEAGRRVYKVNPVDSSRECAACGHIDPKNRFGAKFYCLRCHHTEHADVNAAQVIAARGQAANAAWVAMGSPALSRPVPRKLRRKRDQLYGAGSAPCAAVA